MDNLCWASVIEKDISDNIDNKILDNKLEDHIPSNDEILNSNYEKLSHKIIINYQYIITNDIRTNIKSCIDNNSEIDVDNYLVKFKWLYDVNNFLGNKMKLPDIPMKETSKDGISRSSYKFCEYSYDCEFNYPKNINSKKQKGCYKQHFVYNYLKTDIQSIIHYLENNELENINYNELMKCMNTILFVINKMKDEIENIQLKYGNKYDDYIMNKWRK